MNRLLNWCPPEYRANDAVVNESRRGALNRVLRLARAWNARACLSRPRNWVKTRWNMNFGPFYERKRREMLELSSFCDNIYSSINYLKQYKVCLRVYWIIHILRKCDPQIKYFVTLEQQYGISEMKWNR